MTPTTIALLSVSMSADAFAASLAKGAALDRPRLSEAFRTGAIFGVVEAATPILGWLLGFAASPHIAAWDHWVAFALLAGIGGRMLWSALTAGAAASEPRARPSRHGLWVLVATAIGTSLDAMAVGVSLAFLGSGILLIAGAIGLATFIATTAGILVGRLAGGRVGRWAEGVGGAGLIAIGASIPVEHLHLL
jgi:putative Mn2+ efflux pump MntP